VQKQVVIDTKLKTGGERGHNKADWGMSIKEAKLCVGL
jgi:hypothetical protein